MILANQKDLFNMPSGFTYLNCASMSPMLRKVNLAGIDAINKRNKPWEITMDDWFGRAEELRSLFAEIIRSDKEHIALIPSASYGMAIAAKNISLTDQQKIIILDQQFPSNVYAWLDLSKSSGAGIITVKRTGNQNWTEAIIANINSHTGLVAIPNCHWTDGSLIDLEKVSEEVKKVNARLVIDASQSLGVYSLDINKIKPDFLITVGYKWLLGPYNLAFLYAADEYCETGKPIEFSSLNKAGSEDFAKLADYTDEYKPGARRFDAGEFSSFIHVAMSVAGLTQILDWGVENIQETLSELTDEIERKANASGLETTKRNSRVGHIIGIKFSDSQVATLTKKLTDNQVFISFRGSNMRIAPHLYNSKEDIDKLFDCLQT